MVKQLSPNYSIKDLNRKTIFRLFCEHDALSKQDIVTLSGLSLPTVTQNLTGLCEAGLIAASGQVRNTGGRNAAAYSLCRLSRTAIGMDITRNHVSVVAVDLYGEIITSIRVKTPFFLNDIYFQKLGSLVEEIIKKGSLERDSILGVGISLPALVTTDNETVFYGEILNITGLTRAKISEHIPFPTMLFNDANAAIFAERWKDRSLSNAFYIMLSNNVGGAVIINGDVYVGEHVRSGEIGHMTIVPNGKLCYCGQYGCVDQYCSATCLSDLCDGDLDEFFRLLGQKDVQATALWDEYLDYLAMAVNNVQMLFDCRIILGGYVGGYIGEYLPDLQARLAKRHSFEADGTYLQACIYRFDALAAGAALNFISRFIDQI